MAVDLNRIAVAAAEAYLHDRKPAGDDSERNGDGKRGGDGRIGGLGAVALGMGLALAARAAYGRVRRFDLERAAGAVEDKLSR